MESDIILTILICTIQAREKKLRRLLDILIPQIDSSVSLVMNADDNMTVGEKRNRLVGGAAGKYVCFVDDDDLVSNDYVKKITDAIKSGYPDCVGIQGIMLTNSNCPRRFFHTIEVNNWYTNGSEYYRAPNHLNPIKKEIVQKVQFNSFKSFWEDLEFSSSIKHLLKTEVMIDDPVYYYLYNMKPNEVMFA
jgi:hypothetical protein